MDVSHVPISRMTRCSAYNNPQEHSDGTEGTAKHKSRNASKSSYDSDRSSLMPCEAFSPPVGRTAIPSLSPGHQGACRKDPHALLPHVAQEKAQAFIGVYEASTTAARLPCCHATTRHGFSREMKAWRHQPRQIRLSRSFAPSKSPFTELRSKPQPPQTA